VTSYEDADGHVVVKGEHDWLPALCVGPCSESRAITEAKLGLDDFPLAYEASDTARPFVRQI